MTEKRFTDPELGIIRVRKNARARRIILRVNSSREVILTIPPYCTLHEGMLFLSGKRSWVMEALKRSAPGPMLTPEEIAAIRKEAGEYLPQRFDSFAREYGFEYNRLYLKLNRSNWGSCSSKGNVNLNVMLMKVPPQLRDYVMLHELCHLRYMNHGAGFHALLESICPGHREMERALKAHSQLLRNFR